MSNTTITFIETEGTDLIDSPIDGELHISSLEGFIEDYDGILQGALELIFSAPAFDHVDSHELEADIGSGIHAVVNHGDTNIIVTGWSYDPNEGISEDNLPLESGSKINVNNQILEFVEYSDKTFIFENPEGETTQIKTENITEFLSTE